MSIRFDRLSHTYLRGTPCEKTALRDISLELAEGSRVGIAGPTGSGKTTLIQHLNGLLKPTSGKVLIDGLEVCDRNLKESRRKVGIVFQHPERQFFADKVSDEIAFALSGRGITGAEAELRVAEALRSVGLEEGILGRSPFTLSAGQKRRVAIASVIVSRPQILVLDEPGAALDPSGRREILDSLDRLQRDLRFTLILLTHNMDDLVRLCDRVVVLNKGEVALQGETREVFRDAEALARVGVAAPQITFFMRKLKTMMPEVDDSVLTVDEARDELLRVLDGRQQRKAFHNEGYDHGEIFPRRLRHPQIGPEDKDRPDNDLHGGCLFA